VGEGKVNACLAEKLCAPAGLQVLIPACADDAADVGLDEGAGTRGPLSGVAAWLERDVHGRAAKVVPRTSGLLKCFNLGMRLAKPGVVTDGQDSRLAGLLP